MFVFAAGLTIDLASKSWAFRCVSDQPITLAYDDIAGNPSYRLPFHAGVKALPWDLLDFRLVLNHGAVFGMGQQNRMVFIAFTIIAVMAALWIFGWWTAAKNRVAHIGIGLVLAGGIGNLYDRLVYGAVRDFLFMTPRWHLPFGLHWPGGSTELFPWIFNGADTMLLLGMAILLINAQRREETPKVAKDSEAPPASVQ
ncbi:MAG: signal peptidase II [Planctomycetes bacterium]|nr:signal peptidase II [Planctomycetota bacterium]